MKRFILLVILGAQCIALTAAAQSIDFGKPSTIQQQITAMGKANVIVELKTSSTQMRQGVGVLSLDGQLMTSATAAISQFRGALSSALSTKVRHQFQYTPAAVLEVDQNDLAQLRANPQVKNIFPNTARKAFLADSVKKVFPTQSRSDYNGGNEWAVAVLDTGADTSHSFLNTDGASKVVSEACYSGGGYTDPEVQRLCPGGASSSTAAGSGRHCTGLSGCDHGTHVAGIAVGNRDGSSVDGMAFNGRLIPIQVFTRINSRDICRFSDSCLSAYDSDLIQALERVYALRNTVKIAAVNMSLGGGKFDSSCNSENTVIAGTIGLLRSAGIATVIASGNNGYGSDISFPACISNAIAVGASYDNDTEASYSNASALLDLFAPGSGIVSSVPGEGFVSLSGTSMAAPHVAGAFAVLRHAMPSASVYELESLLKSVGPLVSISSLPFSRRRLALSDALEKTGFGLPEPVPKPDGFNVAPILLLLLLDDEYD